MKAQSQAPLKQPNPQPPLKKASQGELSKPSPLHFFPFQPLSSIPNSKQLSHIPKKNLDLEFASAEINNELSAKAPPSDVTDANQNGYSEEGSLLDLTPVNMAPSGSVAISDLTQFSTTTEKYDKSNCSANHYGSSSQVFLQNVSVEADEVSDILRKAQAEVLKSADIGDRSKMLLDALVRINIENFYSLPKEKDDTSKLICAKILVVLITFLLPLVFLATFGSHSSYRGPLPT